MLKIEPPLPPTTPREAATVIVLREESDGFSVFMVRRHQKSGFMGGAFVFPGGKVDALDADSVPMRGGTTAAHRAFAASEGGVDSAARFYAAALRETQEEAGLLLATGVDTSGLERARALAVEGTPVREILEQIGASFDLSAIVPYARWITPSVEQKRFDARFFVALAPEGQVGRHDEHETVESVWMRPSVGLDRAVRGEIQLPPPTHRTLECLAGFASANAVMLDAQERMPPLIEPLFVDDDGTYMLVLPGDPLHEDPEARVGAPTRFILHNGRWCSGDPLE